MVSSPLLPAANTTAPPRSELRRDFWLAALDGAWLPSLESFDPALDGALEPAFDPAFDPAWEPALEPVFEPVRTFDSARDPCSPQGRPVAPASCAAISTARLHLRGAAVGSASETATNTSSSASRATEARISTACGHPQMASATEPTACTAFRR